MRAPTIATLLLGTTLMAAVSGAAPASAQTERLPTTSRAERQVNDINRSIQGQQGTLRQNQQTQFEINQLRGEIQREGQFRSMTGPGSGAGCPPGSVGC